MGNLKENDLLYAYQTDYDANGIGILMHEIYTQIIGFDDKGKPIIKVLTGAEYLNTEASGMKFVKIGNTLDAGRQSGISFDTITNNAPRIVVYDGLNDYTKLFESTITIAQIGKLGNIYNANLGGYLTDTALSNGTPLYGIYTKSLFADLSGNSKFILSEGTENYFKFDNGLIDIATTSFKLKATNIGLYSSNPIAGLLLGDNTNYDNAKIGLLADGSGKIANNTINWDITGLITISNAIEMGDKGVIRIKDAGFGASGYVLDINGLRGYDSVLGETFNLPTDGSAPTFSSGIIKEVEFQIYTSGIIRTNDTVGDGSANSTGLLVNNTGLYICSANQTVANADIKLIPGNNTFRGSVTIIGDTNAVLTGGAADDINNNSTTIDGGKITTGTITLSQLNFTPVADSNVIATINASTEGIIIDASKLTLDGLLQVGGAADDINNNSTTIDGGKITTGTITLSQLNFTPVADSNVIATINASTEGITIVGDKIILDSNVTIDGTFTLNGNAIINGSLNSDKLNITTLSAISADLGEITAGTLKSVTLSTGTQAVVGENGSYYFGSQVILGSGNITITNGGFALTLGVNNDNSLTCTNGFFGEYFSGKHIFINGHSLNFSDLDGTISTSQLPSNYYFASAYGAKSGTIGNTSTGTPLYYRHLIIDGVDVAVVTYN